MGHHEGAGSPQREVLQLLRGALPGHHLQHHAAQEDALLHRQPDHPLCGHLVPLGVGVLPSFRLRREGLPLHLDPALSHCLLPTARRDHPADLPDGAAPRQVLALHHGPGHALGGRHDRRAQRQLPVTGHAQDAPVGAQGVHPSASQSPPHRQAEERGLCGRRGRRQGSRRDTYGVVRRAR